MRVERSKLLSYTNQEISRIEKIGLLAHTSLVRARTGLGGSHTVVTYPPLDALAPIDSQEIISKVSPCSKLSLYLHVAFCEFICPFCHYDTEFARIGVKETEQMRTYIESLKKEMEFWQGQLNGSSLGSIYIGGGTPTSLSESRLLELISATQQFRFSENATFCVETSPLTAIAPDGPKKLNALVKAGVNRISIGLQTFDEQLLRRSRGHGQAEALRAMEVVAGLTDNVNVDLIQDLPGQNDDHLLTDLEYIERFRPSQITLYVLRIRPEASWFPRFMRKSLVLAESRESVRHGLLMREGLKQLGYISQPGGRFVLAERYHDLFKEIRSGLDTTLLGMGVSAYSHGWGFMFRNTYSHGQRQGTRDYVERIETRGHAIETGCVVNELERTAGLLVSGIRYGVPLPQPTQDTQAYLATSRQFLTELVDAQLVEEDAGTFRLTSLGNLFEEEICAMFFSPQMKARIATQPDLRPNGQQTKNQPISLRSSRSEVTRA